MGNINEYINGELKCSHHITHNPDPSSFKMHAHDTCELYFFINGDADYFVEGNVYSLQKNDILIMRQGETHCLKTKAICDYERLTVHFSPLAISENFSNELLRPFYSRPLGRLNLYRSEDFENDYYLTFINAIKKSIDEKKDNAHIIAYLMALLVEICDAYDKKYKSEKEPLHKSTAMNIVDYINRHIFEELTLEKIAERFFMSSSQANRIFRKSVGSSIWEYVIIKRLMAAKEMIENGEGAKAASEKCGFSDYSAFYRAYRKKFGTSPKSRLQK